MAARFLALLIPLALTLPQLRSHMAAPAPGVALPVIEAATTDDSAVQTSTGAMAPHPHPHAHAQMQARVPAPVQSPPAPLGTPLAVAAQTFEAPVSGCSAQAADVGPALATAFVQPATDATLALQAPVAAPLERAAAKAPRRAAPRATPITVAAKATPAPKLAGAKKTRPMLAACLPNAHCAPVTVAKITPVQRNAL